MCNMGDYWQENYFFFLHIRLLHSQMYNVENWLGFCVLMEFKNSDKNYFFNCRSLWPS